jgi:hypothetical protein
MKIGIGYRAVNQPQPLLSQERRYDQIGNDINRLFQGDSGYRP